MTGARSTLLVGAVAVSLAVGVPVAGHGSQQLPADVDVVLEHVDEGGGAIEAIVIEIDYRGDQSVTVETLVTGSDQRNATRWRPSPVKLQPGTTTVELEAPDAATAISGDRATVWLSTGRQLASHTWTVVSAQ